MKTENAHKLIAQNKKAHFNYFLSEYTECGIELKGTEIKSLRVKGCSLADTYVVIRNEEAEIINMNIPTYDQGNIFNHDPLRTRKLLLHKKEIRWFAQKVSKEGFTIVPTQVYFVKGKAKVEIALAKGKQLHDKRETIKQRDVSRKINKGDYGDI